MVADAYPLRRGRVTALAVDVRPLEEHVEAMTTAGDGFALSKAYAAACSDGYAGSTVADLLCGSPQSPVLATVEQLFQHLRKDLRRNGAHHSPATVVPWSLDDGGSGPAMAGPR